MHSGIGSVDDAESCGDRPPIEPLPPGWEAHADAAGSYYWHVPSGTIRRDPPGPLDQPARPRSFFGCSVADFAVCGVGDDSAVASCATSPVGGSTSSASSPSAADVAADVAVDIAEADADTDDISTSATALSTLRRRVRYLGWRYVDPEDVARAERSSGAVNRCILGLAAAEAAGEMCAVPAILELGRQSLRLFSIGDVPDAATADRPLLMPPQPLLAIRLWGVGRRGGGGGGGDAPASDVAGGRHFAYVARDDVNKYVCHVIDCGGGATVEADAAVRIANAVCQRCRRLISQRRRRQQQQQLQRRQRQDLRLSVDATAALSASPFPSPQEEPCKSIPCLYLGCVPVGGPGGLDRLNAAIDAAVAEADDGRRRARPVTARVSPSSLRFEPATSPDVGAAEDSQLLQPLHAVELRVRYLSFMGVSRRSVRHAGFIAQTALGSFECHVCRCEPSCGPLCRTVEAACNLRYQKCLDSLAASPGAGGGGSGGGGEGGSSSKTDIVQAVASLFSGLRRLSIK